MTPLGSVHDALVARLCRWWSAAPGHPQCWWVSLISYVMPCSRSYLENQMAVALGGRVAEELIFGEDDVTTGASGDFQQVLHTLLTTRLFTAFTPPVHKSTCSP